MAQGASYSAALANLERVSSQPTATPITGTHVAGVSSVANLFGLNPQKVQDTITFSMGLVFGSNQYFIPFAFRLDKR
ncbi:hypothetical protein [Candidatus Venteria ishoeyi]|uniref:hypothetical protein n=1 Tax=Candidatus Venteria ishoeyi TaxID=1899563 RepID=UPI0011B07687|nr:hypothetical protein [Candidatus Venteria ishoeyi]